MAKYKDRYEYLKIMKETKKTIWSLEEVIEKLATLEEEGCSNLNVFIENADGSKLIPISFITFEKDEGIVVIG